jgi:hypothetical protein
MCYYVHGYVHDQKVENTTMKKMLCSCLILMVNVNSLAFCDENDKWDKYYTEKYDLIEFDGHLWVPCCLKHSSKCPCLSEDDADDAVEKD